MTAVSMKVVLELPEDLAISLRSVPPTDRNRRVVMWMRAGKRAEMLTGGEAVGEKNADDLTMDERDTDPVEVALTHLRTRAAKRQHARFSYL